MANEKNLKPQSKRTKSEQREIAKKGGKKSGEARRRKRLLKDCMNDLLDLPVNDTKKWNKLSRMGIDAENIDNRALLTASLFMKAVECGDVAAFKEIRDLIGEKGDSVDSNAAVRIIDDI